VDINEYRARVKLLADLRNGGAIFNGSEEHAAVIVENLFRVAKKNVRILSGDLDARVYGNAHVIQRAQEFLGYSDHRLEILVEKDAFSPSHPFLRSILPNDNVSVRVLNPDLSEDLSYHFMTADQDCYRFEEVKGSHKAIASWGDDAAEHLVGIFDEIAPFSTELDFALAEAH